MFNDNYSDTKELQRKVAATNAQVHVLKEWIIKALSDDERKELLYRFALAATKAENMFMANNKEYLSYLDAKLK